MDPLGCCLINGKSFTGNVCKLNLLFPALSTALDSLDSIDIEDFSGRDLRISWSFRADIVISISGSDSVVFSAVAICISKSVAISSRFFSLDLSKTFDSIGNVCRRSTIPVTTCNGFNNSFLYILNLLI